MSEDIIYIPYDHPDAAQAGCSIVQAWAKQPREPAPAEKAELIARIKRMLKEQDAVLVSHYYVHPDLQDLAEETGGIVSDSLDMANFGHQHPARTIVVAGVRFMGWPTSAISIRRGPSWSRVCASWARLRKF